MSEEFESEPQTEDSGINPIGKCLIYAVVLIVVIATVYGIFHTGIDLASTESPPPTTTMALTWPSCETKRGSSHPL